MSTGGGNWIVAIDAGGTSSKAILLSRSGEELAFTTGDGFNLRNRSVDVLRQNVVSMINTLFADGQVMGRIPSAIAVGAAGAGRKQERRFIHDTIKAQYPTSTILVHHDAFIAHYGAFGGGPGVVVTAGTGSIAFGKNSSGVEARSGGWGWMLGDEGSGWWIGREAIRAAMSEWEGSGPATEITSLIKEEFKVTTTYKIIPEIYAGDFKRERISKLSERVFDLAKSGDEVSLEIMVRAGRELGLLAVRTARSLKLEPHDFYVALLGSVATNGGEYIEIGVKEYLKNYTIDKPFKIPERTLYDPDQLSLIDDKTEGKEDPDEEIEENDNAIEYNQVKNRIPVFPPTDLRIDHGKGPGIIKPMENALWGAARWAIEEMNKKMFI